MITTIRRHHQILMIIVTVLVIIAFAWLYNSTNLDRLGNDRVFTAYGRDISYPELERRARVASLSMPLGLYDLFRGLAGFTFDRDQAIGAFTINWILVEHAAQELHLNPTSDQILGAVQALPVFQTNGQFDNGKYAEFIDRHLAPNGLTVTDLERIIRLDLNFKRLRELIAAPLAVSTAELREQYEKFNAPVTVQLVRFKRSDFNPELSDAQIEEYYKANTNAFQSQEKRRVQYAEFLLTEEQKKLEGKDRVSVLQDLADKANAFAEAAMAEGAVFAEAAKEKGIALKTTGDFATNTGAAEFGGVPAVSQAAFQLTVEQPVSDPVQTPNGFYVLHLETVIPAHPLTLEEAREQVVERLRAQKISEAMQQKAQEVRSTLLSALESGKSWAEATASAGVTSRRVGPFSLQGERPEGVDVGEFDQVAIQLQPGQLSELTPSTDGGLLVYLEARGTADEEKFKQEENMLRDQMLQARQQIAMMEWLTKERAAAGINPVMMP